MPLAATGKFAVEPAEHRLIIPGALCASAISVAVFTPRTLHSGRIGLAATKRNYRRNSGSTD